MVDQKVMLDDDGMVLLGNALLLGYLHAMVYRRRNGLLDQEIRIDRNEYSERRQLHEVLELAGAYQDLLSGPINSSGEKQAVRIPEFDDNILRLAASDRPIARLRLADLEFPASFPQLNSIEEQLAPLSAYELRRPLSLLGPTDFTRFLKDIVISYFQGTDSVMLNNASANPGSQTRSVGLTAATKRYLDAEEVTAGGGPRTGCDIKAENMAAKCLAGLELDYPHCRMKKRVAVNAFQELGFSEIASRRIWASGAPKAWKKSGRIRNDQPLISANTLIDCYKKQKPQ